jgi:hypothetical protein
VIVSAGAIEIVVAAIAAGGAILGAAVGGIGSYFVERTLKQPPKSSITSGAPCWSVRNRRAKVQKRSSSLIGP